MARPKTSLLLILLCVLPITAGAFRLRVDFSPEQVYVGHGNAVEFCEQHKRLFRFEDSLALVLLEATDNRTLLRQDCLLWMQQFAADARKLDGVRDVTSLVTLQRPRIALSGDDRVTWVPLFSDQFYDDPDYLQQRLQNVPLLNDTLVSKDQGLLMTLVDLDPADRTIATLTARVSAIEHLLEKLPPPSTTQTFISGVPAIRVDVIRSIVNDQRRMVPVCSALFLLMSLLIFRSPVVTGLSLFGVLSSVALTLGLMGWLGITFSVMSNMIPALVLIIGAANNVHILSRFQVEMRQNPADANICALLTMKEMAHTCFLTLATTAIGFGSLVIAEADLLKSLAIQAAAGMACCYVSLMLVMGPTLVICADRLCPFRSATPTPERIDTRSTSRLDRVWAVFGKWIAEHAMLIVVLHLLLGAFTLWSCRNMNINSFIFETYDGDHPTMAIVHRMDERMSGLISLEVQLQAPDRQRFFDGDVALALARARRQISRDDRVTFYRDYVEFLSEFDHGRVLTDDPEAAAASLRRIKLVLRQLDRKDVTSAFIANDQPLARVMMRIKDVGSASMKDLFVQVEQILRQELPDDIQITLTGDAYLHAVCMDVFVRDLFYSLVAASGVIFILIMLLFRSLRVGLISAVPNMLPLIMTLGYMHLRGYELTAGNVIVFAIGLGIAVDDTIHFLARYRDERMSAEPMEAIQKTLLTSGRAIILTSVLVVSGLSVLVFSDFVPTRRFAELTAVTMCSALPGDIILLPAMLKLFGGSGRRRND
ncbi:MAG: MMPL family transporter [Planctomycetaceae bacterium]